MITKGRTAAVGLVATFAILMSVMAIPAFAPAAEPTRCRVQADPPSLEQGRTVRIMVQIQRAAPSSTYTGTAVVTTPGPTPAGSASYSVSTNPAGNGQTTKTYPNAFAGGSTSAQTTYTVQITLTTNGYNALSCSGTFTVK